MTTWFKPHRWIAALLLGTAALVLPVQAQGLKVGDKAPDFTVVSSTGKPVSLGDYAGKKNVVVFFYIAAFTDT